MRIAIVDDSPVMRNYLVEVVNEIPGMEVVGIYAAATDAIAGLGQVAPEIVLLDICLKAGNGLQVLRHIHKTLPYVAVMVFSDSSAPVMRRLCLDAGARYFFDKTTEVNKLRNQLWHLADLPAG